MIIYEVQKGDNLMEIAYRYMSNPMRWSEIRLLKSAVLQGERDDWDTFRFTSHHNTIFPGDILLVPCSLHDNYLWSEEKKEFVDENMEPSWGEIVP